MNTSIAIQILPLSLPYNQVIAIVDKVIGYIASLGISYEVSAFETTIEGEYEQLMDILKQVVLIAGENNDSVFVNVKMMYNKQGISTIDEKVKKHR